jgi:Na+-transporting NADH:ubiquinone oxidoreductase subunit NqrF
MSKVFIVPGSNYHNKKDQFKKLLKDNKLHWVGTFEAPKWAGKDISVKATFVRENDITIEGQFEVEGTGQPYIDICKYISDELEGKSETDKAKSLKEDSIKKRLRLYDMIHKPDEQILKAGGAPKSYISHVMKSYKENRAKVEQELREGKEEEE